MENRYVLRKWTNSNRSVGTFRMPCMAASLVGANTAVIIVMTNFPSARHCQLPTLGVPVPLDNMMSGKPVCCSYAVPSLVKFSCTTFVCATPDPSPQTSGFAADLTYDPTTFVVLQPSANAGVT